MKGKHGETMAMQAQSSSAGDQILGDQVQGDHIQSDQIQLELSSFSNNLIDDFGAEDVRQSDAGDAEQVLENQYRAGAYSMLAALLRQAPQQEILNTVTGLADVVEEKDDFAIAMSMLGLAARVATPVELDDEYHSLFIGLGRGELVPYGSWYLTGFLMEKPLGVLRDDLAAMGFTRNDGICEPEDHVAALFEVMVLLINEGRSLTEQTLFFDAHILPWLGRFFIDLSEAKSAVFYRSVARFGKAFFNFEKQYLAMRA